MTMFILGDIVLAMLGWLMAFLSVFLVLLILLQRGRGGGLTGALGGPGGQSAFGSKAGDTFTLITIVVASIWGFTCAFTMWLRGIHAPPTTAATSNVSAGPSEDDTNDASSGVVIPTPGGDGAMPGLGGLLEPGSTTTDTPAVELTPRDATVDPPKDGSSEAGSEAAESTEDAPQPAETGDENEAASADQNATEPEQGGDGANPTEETADTAETSPTEDNASVEGGSEATADDGNS